MPDERTSPSAGWRTVYGEMGASTDYEADTLDCPDCGDDSPRVREATFWCPNHGTWTVSASG